jgi:phage-related protein
VAINLNVISKFDDKGIKKATAEISGLGSGLKKLGGLVAAAFSVTAIASFTKEAILGAEAAQQATNRLNQVAKSMNIFGEETAKVTGRLNAFAEAQEFQLGVDADIIKATQAKLLTFKQLALSADEQTGAFDRATKAAIDLAAAGFGAAETNAVQLGKALNDPIKGITALNRSGITFTEIERAKIKELTESGKVLQAQDIILKAIETQVGGTAAATATASAKMTLAFNAMKDGVGEALLPAFESLTKALMPVIIDLGPKLGEVFSRFVPVIASVANALPMIINAMLPVVDLFADFALLVFKIAEDIFPVLIAVFAAIMPAIQALLPIFAEFLQDLIKPLAPALLELINAFMPIVQAILPVIVSLLQALLPLFAALLNEAIKVIIPVLAQFAAAFMPLLQAVLPMLVSLLNNLVVPAIRTMGSVITQVFGTAFKFIGTSLSNTMSVLTAFASSFRGVWSSVGSFLKNVINSMLGMIQSLSNGVIDAVNLMIRALNRIQIKVPDWVPGIGGRSFGFAIPEIAKIRIPQLADGGVVMPQPGGVLANIAEAGQAEAVIPLDRFGDLGGKSVYNINVNAGMGADGSDIGRKIVEEILRYERSSGRVFARA